MNYLAHLFLAHTSDEGRIGSLLADFTVGTMGSMEDRYGDKIALAILHHRQVDRFTDSHLAVQNSINALGARYGIFGGIIVDVVFDHFLLRHFDQFSDQPLNSFFEAVYTSLDRWDWEFPPRYQRVVKHLLERRWLDSYRHLENVAFALRKIDERFSRKTPLTDALPGIKANYAVLERDFLTFFPELMTFSDDAHRRLSETGLGTK